jgi:hypothetical protein
MRTSTSMAYRQGDAMPQQPASLALRRIAACVFAAAPAEEDEILGFVAAAREIADADLAFFVTAWSAERIAANRIASGDFGIDEILARIAERRRDASDAETLAGDGEWLALLAEYRSLADEILIDTLNEFREFEMVVAYSGRREEYSGRCAAGMRALARAVPELAGNRRAARRWRDDFPVPALAN